MKHTLLTTLTALTLAACGTEQGSDLNHDVSHLDFKNEFTNLMNVEADKLSVVVLQGQTRNGTPFSRSTAILDFNINCVNKLGPVQSHVEYTDEGATIFYSAPVLVSPKSTVVLCGEIKPTRIQIPLLGLHTKENVKLVSMGRQYNQKLPTDFKNATTLKDSVQVKDVKVCPENARCPRLRATLQVTTVGCMDKASISVQKEELENKLILKVATLNLASKKSDHVRCFVANTETFTVFGSKAYDKDQIEIVHVN